jgi:putative oxidoreductase
MSVTEVLGTVRRYYIARSSRGFLGLLPLAVHVQLQGSTTSLLHRRIDPYGHLSPWYSGGILRYLDRLQPLALVAVRIVLGAIMVAHGSHKVFGGLHHVADMAGHLGLPSWLGYVSAFVEFVGGILILLGLGTRCAAFAICINMGVAIWKVHWHNGLMGSPDRPGYEFPLSVAALAFALIFFGGGPISLDHVIRGEGGRARFPRT